MTESGLDGPASPAAAPQVTGIAASIVLALTYPLALLLGSFLGEGVVIKLSGTRAVMLGGGEWIEWSQPALGAVFCALAVALLVWLLRGRVPTRRERLIVLTWSVVIFCLGGLWALVGWPADVVSFMTDVPGAVWAMVAGGLAGFWLVTRRRAA